MYTAEPTLSRDNPRSYPRGHSGGQQVVEVVRGPVEDIRGLLARSPVAEVLGAEQTMRECLFRSVEVWHGKYYGEVACVWGVIPPTLLSVRAYLWLLTTDIIAEHKFLFIRYSQRYIDAALACWPELYGDVIGDNPQAKRWLKHLGAKFGPEAEGRTPFVIKRNVLDG